MTVPFTQIPANLRIPLFAAEFGQGFAGNQETQRALLISQTVTAASEVPVFMPTSALAVGTFGGRSMLAAMVEAYRAADPFGELWVLPLTDNSGGSAAAGSIAFTGPATAAGTLALYVAGRSIPVAVTLGMTAAQLATAVAAACQAYVSPNGVQLPVTAAVDGSVNSKVDFTAVNKGAVGNSISIYVNFLGTQNGEATPAGIGVTITAMAGGATDPDLGGLDAILSSQTYDFIGLGGYTGATDLNEMQTLLQTRWSWLRQDYGHVWNAKMDADATGVTNLAFGATRNDPHMTVVSYEPSPTPPWVVAATWTGACAPSLVDQPNRPLQTLALPGILAPQVGGRYTKSIQQSMLSTGLALMKYAADGTCTILRSVTTYQTNQWGAADQSLLDAETNFTGMAFIRTLRADIEQAYPRALLADDGNNFGAGLAIVTPKSARATILNSYRRMITQGLVEDVDIFAQGLIVERNANDASRMDVLVDPIYVSGLRIFAVLTQFYLLDPANTNTTVTTAA